MANSTIIPFYIGCINFITHWGCSQDFVDFVFVSKNNLSGYFDYSVAFVLFDNLDIEQVLWGNEARVRWSTWTRFTGWIFDLPINFGVLRWCTDLTDRMRTNQAFAR